MPNMCSSAETAVAQVRTRELFHSSVASGADHVLISGHDGGTGELQLLHNMWSLFTPCIAQ
jgi:hypothetical protein